MIYEAFCPVCYCEFSIYLGQIGDILHLRCRDCGFNYNVRV